MQSPQVGAYVTVQQCVNTCASVRGGGANIECVLNWRKLEETSNMGRAVTINRLAQTSDVSQRLINLVANTILSLLLTYKYFFCQYIRRHQ